MVNAAEAAITSMGADATTLGIAALAIVAIIAVFALAKAFMRRAH